MSDKGMRVELAWSFTENDAHAIVAAMNSLAALLDVAEAAQRYGVIMDNNEGYLCEEELALRAALAKLESRE